MSELIRLRLTTHRVSLLGREMGILLRVACLVLICADFWYSGGPESGYIAEQQRLEFRSSGYGGGLPREG
jgi:hypothetical protein